LIDVTLDLGAPFLGCLKLDQLQLGLMLFFASFEVKLLDDLVESFNKLLLVLDATDQLRLVVFEIVDVTLGLLIDDLGGIGLFQNLKSPRLQSSIIVQFILLLLVNLPRIDLGCLASIPEIVSVRGQCLFGHLQSFFLISFLFYSLFIQANFLGRI